MSARWLRFYARTCHANRPSSNLCLPYQLSIDSELAKTEAEKKKAEAEAEEMRKKAEIARMEAEKKKAEAEEDA